MQRYESILEIWSALKRRRIQLTREEVEVGLMQLDLRAPFDSEDLKELITHLGPQHKVNQRVIKTKKVLFSKQWRDAVGGVRMALWLPYNWLSQEQARDLHQGLLDTLVGGQPKDVLIGTGERQLRKFEPEYWKNVFEGTRRLCPVLGIDGSRLDNLIEVYASQSADILLGIRKLLDPEGVFIIEGQELRYEPGQTDHLVGHVIWGHPLNPGFMEPRPSVSYQWVRLPHGGGKFLSHTFNEAAATSSELKELQRKLRDIKRMLRDGLLLSVIDGDQWHGVTWEERWGKWNRLFPDYSYLTVGAMRKACEYAVKHRAEIRSRFQKLTQPESQLACR